MISSPLRSRFSGGVFRLEFYDEAEIEEIIYRSAKILGVKLDKEAAHEIAKRARFTPRTANYFLKRVRDFAQVEGLPMDKDTAKQALKLLGIDDKGLSPSDRKLLELIADKFGGGPVGLGTLAAALSEEEATIEEFNEPYLLQLGFIERTSRGRALTEHGYNHLGKNIPKNLQKKLL
jgi:Holliday junction DNA helicase RuvB